MLMKIEEMINVIINDIIINIIINIVVLVVVVHKLRRVATCQKLGDVLTWAQR